MKNEAGDEATRIASPRERRPAQFSFHQIEGVDVRQLPLERLGAGEAHRQQSETVAVHLEAPMRLDLPSALQKLGCAKLRTRQFRGFDDQSIDCAQHVAMVLHEGVGDVAAVRADGSRADCLAK